MQIKHLYNMLLTLFKLQQFNNNTHISNDFQSVLNLVNIF